MNESLTHRERAVERMRRHMRRMDSIGHLVPEAIVSFVDGEMDPKAMHRVRVHLVHCEDCRAEVNRQRGAADWVRKSDVEQAVSAPLDLLHRLNGIASQSGQESAEAVSNSDDATGARKVAHKKSVSLDGKPEQAGSVRSALRKVLRRADSSNGGVE